MSQYGIEPLDFTHLKTIRLAERGGKVRAVDFAEAYARGSGVRALIDSLPRILAGNSFRAVLDAMIKARAQQKAILWALGGHVIKCGLAPVLIDLMRRGFVTAFAMNGAAAIHDFEIALAGRTSEDVEAVLPDGRFGSARETGEEMNRALVQDLGAGEAYGRRLQEIASPEFAPCSVLHQTYAANVPLTVHIAIGTDTPHTHPAASGAALGEATHRDFRLFCSLVARLDDGGVFVNAGSAVIMPEVFLKAVSAVRNLGHPLANFTTVNLDFLQHYRPRVNVVERPHAQSGGRGYALTGHHELIIPLIAAALIERSE